MTRPPDFILAGAQRAGSTALAEALAEHPDVSITDPKEPSYFATLFGSLDYSGPGDPWFASQNVADWDAYLELCDSGAAVSGEASVMYLAIPGTAAAIRERLPDVKIVMVLRDPLIRARSAHAYLRVKGRETEKSFATALAHEHRRRETGYGPMWWFEGASDYAPGLEEYIAAFGREQVFVTTNEELKADPARVLADVSAFLGVSESSAPVEYLSSNAINSGGVPKSELLTRILYPPDSVRRFIRGLAPEKLRDIVRSARKKSTTQATPHEDELSAEVIARFHESARRTGDVLGRDMSDVWPSARGENAE
ncbi:sulfotransferase domain-containing protein [Microbacterium sp. G2-8]|uniref:sulfotransferase domain-containing protein n=1 Tax=Microbacterium sp. G2-8 TaxID=2842454 RepID=UPI001C8A2B4B|nr:sulfotransferase domain-containing protein [Microbacterium sp. G2-8]